MRLAAASGIFEIDGSCFRRLILNLDLIQNGYPPINVKFTDRKKYYNAFDEYYKNNDITPMVKLIAGYVTERLKQYLNILQ